MAVMRALQTEAIRKPMVLREVEVPEIGDHDALVRVVASGICRTDWHVWNGNWSWAGLDLPLPITLGHEIGGVVERVGSEVTKQISPLPLQRAVIIAGRFSGAATCVEWRPRQGRYCRIQRCWLWPFQPHWISG
jgi:D-arabinose 1-dehydrogenase-like Zn-dependent alcohol dehydrogenase